MFERISSKSSFVIPSVLSGITKSEYSFVFLGKDYFEKSF